MEFPVTSPSAVAPPRPLLGQGGQDAAPAGPFVANASVRFAQQYAHDVSLHGARRRRHQPRKASPKISDQPLPTPLGAAHSPGPEGPPPAVAGRVTSPEAAARLLRQIANHGTFAGHPRPAGCPPGAGPLRSSPTMTPSLGGPMSGVLGSTLSAAGYETLHQHHERFHPMSPRRPPQMRIGADGFPGPPDQPPPLTLPPRQQPEEGPSHQAPFMLQRLGRGREPLRRPPPAAQKRKWMPQGEPMVTQQSAKLRRSAEAALGPPVHLSVPTGQPLMSAAARSRGGPVGGARFPVFNSAAALRTPQPSQENWSKLVLLGKANALLEFSGQGRKQHLETAPPRPPPRRRAPPAEALQGELSPWQILLNILLAGSLSRGLIGSQLAQLYNEGRASLRRDAFPQSAPAPSSDAAEARPPDVPVKNEFHPQ